MGRQRPVTSARDATTKDCDTTGAGGEGMGTGVRVYEVTEGQDRLVDGADAEAWGAWSLRCRGSLLP